MDRPVLHSNFARQKTSSSSHTSMSTSASSTATTAATSTSISQPTTSSASAIQYDHETYLELLAGRSSHVEKTASQLYKEERARKLSLRAQDPAVLTGPVDLDIGVFGGYRYDGVGKGDASRK